MGGDVLDRPLFTLKWVYWLQGLGEHTGLTHEPNTLLNTRTFKTNAFMRWLHWNMVYHTAHHTFTSVPFHALPTLHREIEESYPHPMNQVGYLRCHWEIFRELLRGRTEYDLVADADARYAKPWRRQPRARPEPCRRSRSSSPCGGWSGGARTVRSGRSRRSSG